MIDEVLFSGLGAVIQSECGITSSQCLGTKDTSLNIHKDFVLELIIDLCVSMRRVCYLSQRLGCRFVF